jgi:hypothetical protein
MNRLVIVAVALSAAVAAGWVTSCAPGAPPPIAPAPIPKLVPPLSDAATEEWVRLEAGTDARVFRVVAVTDFEVTVEITHYHGGEPAAKPWTETWPRNGWGLPRECLVRSIDPDRVEVGGKSYACWRFLVVNRARQEFWWFTDELPVHGALKIAALQKSGPDETGALRAVDWSGK